MSNVQCGVELIRINEQLIIRLPKKASEKLPSRGMVMAECAINDSRFAVALEPDGQRSHWFICDREMQKAAGVGEGEEFSLSLKPLKDWPEPKVPEDLKQALDVSDVFDLWNDVTTKARWDWIRWVRSTKNPETRKGRIEKTISKLKGGKRNPCCFNRSMCTVPELSKSGVLLEPENA